MSKVIPRAVTSLIDPKHPVINALGNTFGGYLPGRRSPVRGVKAEGKQARAVDKYGLSPRIDVIDEKLCDHVLQYLAPTLEPYKGCTIIDAHPGACVWSARLNKFLKPKQHLLMEPDERYVEGFIKPLLDKPGSTFKYVPHAAASEKGVLEAFKAALGDDKLISPPPGLSNDDPRLRQLDTSVLVTGNLARNFPWLQPVGSKHPPIAHSALQQLTIWAGDSHKTFSAQGLVRMLWWLPDQHKAQIIPHVGYLASAFNMGMQMGAQMTEVVGVEPAMTYALKNHTRTKAVSLSDRMPLYDAEISKLVRRKMDEAGMKIPRGRTVLGPKPASSKNAQMRSPVQIRYHTIEELKTAIANYRSRHENLLPALDEAGNFRLPSKVNKVLGSWLKSVEYPQCHVLARDFTRLQTRQSAETLARATGWERSSSEPTGVEARITLILDLELRIINLEAHYKALEEQEQEVSALKQDILHFDADLRAQDIYNRIPIPEFLHRAIADQLSFFSNPPLLPFDRRPYEPLATPLTSFWPRHPLALLDIIPTARDLTVPGIADRYEATRTTSELIKYLFTYKNVPLPLVLDKIAPNAAQDLIPLVPALADPRKGGRLDVGNLRARMLSEEMMEGLVRAWFEWPFKPRLIDLALMADGGGDGDSAGEGMGEVDGQEDVTEA